MNRLSLLAGLCFFALLPCSISAQGPPLVGQYEEILEVGTGTVHLRLDFRADGTYRWEDNYAGNLNDYLTMFVPPEQIGIELGEGSFHAVFEGNWTAQDDRLTITGAITELKVNDIDIGVLVGIMADLTVAQTAQQQNLSTAETDALREQVTAQFQELQQMVEQVILSQNVMQSRPYFFQENTLYISTGAPDLYYYYTRVSPASAVSGTSWGQVKAGWAH